ncbi:putative ABC transport system ATP-binding protein/macrolide transport system ATP-binding/permease protein [Geodermatophilus pulveris]|uniref:Putative ABC transport system ATP-binding protein/macrolide transport system ATP-binding/permease protein n=1 Tax=Geodermatophilus pulveris TaxID=1564159 RepID=A0A239DAE2_9ACTN|nr:ATP-binding cassette domain-containing protein [Geodermatophilus pulveris]SNS29260.1 putative ABC transport system ATP-binding protein/macrolide transport system ATP-binding/permease protein [Geodermatophilus pulveris]
MSGGPAPTRGEAAAAVRDVVKTHRTATGAVTALDRVTLAVPRARVTVVTGPSGSGKSTLLRLLACVDRPDTGQVWVAGQRVDALRPRARRRVRRRQVAYLFQRPGENLLPYLGAAEQVRLAARLRGVPVADGEVHRLLDRLDLAGRAEHRPAQLSGGEQQRLAVACGVVGGPEFVVADEPTAELDTRAAERVLAAVAGLARSGVAFVLSSHDPRVLAVADGVVRLDHGRVLP